MRAVSSPDSSIVIRSTRPRPSAPSASGARSVASIARTTAALTGVTGFTRTGCIRRSGSPGRSASSGNRLGLFVGTLRHRRFTPVAHAFTYPLFMALLDIDRVPELMPFAAHQPQPVELGELRRPRPSRRSDRPLRERLVADAARHGIEVPAGPMFLLTHLRYLGYGFNPVSFFYCFDRAESCRSSSPR